MLYNPEAYIFHYPGSPYLPNKFNYLYRALTNDMTHMSLDKFQRKIYLTLDVVFDKFPRDKNINDTAIMLYELLSTYDVPTARHSREVAELAVLIGKEYLKEEATVKNLHLLYYSAILHDVGKIGVLSLMNTVPQSKEQAKAILKRKNLHVQFGEYILNKFPFFKDEIEIIKPHHAHQNREGKPIDWDNEFYPLTQILIVADAYHSITHNRPGDPAHNWYDTLAILHKDCFPQPVVNALERIKPSIPQWSLA
jgi:HD-GYP domain-containing protein (c-di-GMP phosphodiesterase class II)